MVIFGCFCGAYTYIIHEIRAKVNDCFGLYRVGEGLYLHIWGSLGRMRDGFRAKPGESLG